MKTLGVFAKWPEPGRVKTRLGQDALRSAMIAEAFLLDTLERCATLADVRGIVVFAPENAAEAFQAMLPTGWQQEAQTEGDLGRRLTHFFQRHLPNGPVVALGTDSPTLPLDYVATAFALLEGNQADVVLGPACDGGYYLVGVRKVLPPLFVDIEWSSARVLEQTVAALGEPGDRGDPCHRLRLLPPWYDVDTPTDWQLLCGHLAALRRAGEDACAPRTEALAHPGDYGPTTPLTRSQVNVEG